MSSAVTPREPVQERFELAQTAPGHFRARGALVFATAGHGRQAGASAFEAAPETHLEVDCAEIAASDSAGMCVLLDWLALAARAGRSLRLVNLPKPVQALARISDVLELLEAGV